MWIRSAFWMGQVKPGMGDQFETLVNRSLVPGLRSLPGVRDAKALWPRKREDDPPGICCQVVVDFDSRADLDRMLASSERAALRPTVLAAVALFDGDFSHIDYEVGVR